MRPEGHNKKTVTSWDYIRDNFHPGDRLAVVIKREQGNGLIQRIATAEQLAGSRFQAWLRFENVHGANVYLGMNPLKPDAHGRTKKDIAVVRHLYLDLDWNGSLALAGILEDPQLPKPSYILNTSVGKHQVVWKVAGFGIEEAERFQRAMASRHGADRAATDVTRVLRIPGLCNRKYDPPFQVTAEKLSETIYFPSEFRIQLHEKEYPEKRATALRTQVRAGQISQSERDWAETLRRLGQGENPAVVEMWLRQKRSDKPDPAFYAALTIRKAVAELHRRQAAELTVDLG